MSVMTLEGVVEGGQIRLNPSVRLPENTRVYVLVPGAQSEPVARVASPRLAHPEQGKDFVLDVTEFHPDA